MLYAVLTLVGGALLVVLMLRLRAPGARAPGARTPIARAPPGAAVTITGPASTGPAGQPAAATCTAADLDRLGAANAQATARLWKLAFAAPSQAQASAEISSRVRDNVVAMLDVDTLDPDHFPRRPALMAQLMRAVNDPRAESERISRIIAHDPVLTADVLRLANSSSHRTTATPVETLQRAVVVCGVDGLRGLLAIAMLRPVFRATRKNFPRFPRILWDRTERATRAAELYALETDPKDRFEAQMAVLLGALGPLVVYGAVLDVYARNPHFSPDADLCVELIVERAPGLSRRMARDWEASPRLLAALGESTQEPLAVALRVGELLGTLALLEARTILSSEARRDLIVQAGISAATAARVWEHLTRTA
jgi:hypothetical protein